jgi:hypothetical protein
MAELLSKGGSVALHTNNLDVGQRANGKAQDE